MSRRVGRWEIAVHGVENGEVVYSLTCLECGSPDQTRRGDGTNMDMVYCSACRVWMGRLAMFSAKAAIRANKAGFEIDVRRYLPRKAPP
jgi:hypothetical protein